MRKTIPAVSIIIPMYNAEKYIGDCLDSILAQTFNDYEVILVDDCSTDKSCDVVEKYLPKFNKDGIEKLKFIRSKVNSNTPGMPRNVGLRFSRGEYILFVDSDDAITETALEELYDIAKKFDADLLYCEKHYMINLEEKFTTKKSFLQEKLGYNSLTFEPIIEPTFVSNDIVERIKGFISYRLYLSPWKYFIRRDLISKHDLRFPNIKYHEDHFWNLFLICLAQNFLIIPNIIYIYRKTPNSITTSQTSLEIEFHRYADHAFQGITLINQFAEKFLFLKEHPKCRYALFNFVVSDANQRVLSFYSRIPACQLEPLVIKELDKIKDKTALTAFLFARMNTLSLNHQAYKNKTSKVMQKAAKVIQQQQEIIQNQAAQIKFLQTQLSNAHDVFNR